MAHYAANEWAHALLADSAHNPPEQHPTSHSDTHVAFAQALPLGESRNRAADLNRLQTLSAGARYLRGNEREDSWWKADHRSIDGAVDEAILLLRNIKEVVLDELS